MPLQPQDQAVGGTEKDRRGCKRKRRTNHRSRKPPRVIESSTELENPRKEQEEEKLKEGVDKDLEPEVEMDQEVKPTRSRRMRPGWEMFEKGAGLIESSKTGARLNKPKTEGQHRGIQNRTIKKTKTKKGSSINWGLGHDLVKVGKGDKNKSKCDLNDKYTIVKFLRPVEGKEGEFSKVDTEQSSSRALTRN